MVTPTTQPNRKPITHSKDGKEKLKTENLGRFQNKWSRLNKV